MSVLTVAAIQATSVPRDLPGNLQRIEPLIRSCAARGAQLVLLPELYSSGYGLTKADWACAESLEEGTSVTCNFLKRLCSSLRVHVCTTVMEKDQEGDIYNTCIIVDDNGVLIGKVRKQIPASFEAFLFKRPTPSSHVINTTLGRIGIGICYENSLCFLPHDLENAGAQVLLMPHACPTPTASVVFPAYACRAIVDNLASIAELYARKLCLPVVMSNHSGPWRTSILDLPGLTQASRFPGLSTIVDSDGCVVAQLADQENTAIVGQVHLRALPHLASSALLASIGPPSAAYLPWTAFPRWVCTVFGFVERLGGLVYTLYPRTWRAHFSNTAPT